MGPDEIKDAGLFHAHRHVHTEYRHRYGGNWAANRPVPPIHMWRSGTLVRGGLSLAPGAAEVRRQGLVSCSALLFALVSFS